MNATSAPDSQTTHPARIPLQQGAAAPARGDQKAFRLFMQTLFRSFFKVRIIGKENIPHTPVIICPNHLGWADPVVILLFFPVEPRIYVVGVEEIHDNSPIGRRMIDWLQIMVPVDGHPYKALHTMEDVVARGGSLLIFPEGNLGTVEGQLQPLQPGAAHAAIRTGAPLLPVGLTGTRELWLRRAITVRVGQPIYPEPGNANIHARINALNARLAPAIQALLPGDPSRPLIKPLSGLLTHLT